MAAAGSGGDAARLELRRRIAEQRAACERQIAAGRDRLLAASAAFRATLLSVRSGSGSYHQTLSQQEQLTGLKGRFGELEAQLAQVLSTKLTKESKCELIKESILRTAAINEQLKQLVIDERDKRDQYATVISSQLGAVEALEANNKEYETWRKDIEEAVSWYHEFLGFQVVGGEGVKFIFNKVDLQSPEKEYSFSIKLDKDRYSLVRCDPHMKDSEELMNDLNLTDDLFKFVRILRQRFQAATLNGFLPTDASSTAVSTPVAMSADARSEKAGPAVCTDSSSTAVSSPVVISADARSENAGPVVCTDAPSTAVSTPVIMSADARSENVADESHSRSKSKKKVLPTKRRASALSAASPGAVVSSVRRSPRFLGNK